MRSAKQQAYHEQEEKLWQAWFADRSIERRRELLAFYEGLVIHRARKFADRRRMGRFTGDLVSAAVVRMAEAIERCEEAQRPYSRYMERQMMGAMLDFCRSTDLYSRYTRSRVRERTQRITALTAELSRRPTAEEIDQVTAGLLRPEEDFVVLSLDDKTTSESGAETYADRHAAEDPDLTDDQLAELLRPLGLRLKTICYLHYACRLSQKQIADVLEVSPSQVCLQLKEARERIQARYIHRREAAAAAGI